MSNNRKETGEYLLTNDRMTRQNLGAEMKWHVISGSMASGKPHETRFRRKQTALDRERPWR